ncbi:hypothetical protein ACRALDRAFT_209655 [Sodiomyces alcalophilus JCM 7366]|uniref:uncharacterized protein n=1 Tax=Sodiomyces alcalophilus JCM 7366 TaxID=591952 RepID=UPI0039B4F390
MESVQVLGKRVNDWGKETKLPARTPLMARYQKTYDIRETQANPRNDVELRPTMVANSILHSWHVYHAFPKLILSAKSLDHLRQSGACRYFTLDRFLTYKPTVAFSLSSASSQQYNAKTCHHVSCSSTPADMDNPLNFAFPAPIRNPHLMPRDIPASLRGPRTWGLADSDGSENSVAPCIVRVEHTSWPDLTALYGKLQLKRTVACLLASTEDTKYLSSTENDARN